MPEHRYHAARASEREDQGGMTREPRPPSGSRRRSRAKHEPFLPDERRLFRVSLSARSSSRRNTWLLRNPPEPIALKRSPRAGPLPVPAGGRAVDIGCGNGPLTIVLAKRHPKARVTETKDKRKLVKEALRVVRKGGRFAFPDLFLIKALYGGIDDLMETIKGWGTPSVSFADTSASDYIPRALKLPFMVGRIGVIYGTK